MTQVKAKRMTFAEYLNHDDDSDTRYDWSIPEYWIVDLHPAQVTVLKLINNTYQAKEYTDQQTIKSVVFSDLIITAKIVLNT